jgi:hypothetical protein
MIRWIVIHWFELGALGLLALNLWFIYAVLRTLRAVQEALIAFMRWVDENRDKAGGDATPE